MIETGIYLPGEGSFVDGPASSPQQFSNGAFVIFQGRAANLPDFSDQETITKAKPKLVQAGVVVSTRTLANNDPINLNSLATQQSFAPTKTAAKSVPPASTL